MEEKDKHSHFQPLIPHSLHQHYSHKNLNHFFTISNIINNNNIILRIFLILLLALISLWANIEASKTFDITVVNDAGDSPAGRRFAVSYVSNGEASRILLNTSSYVQQFLYPKSNNNDSYHKKDIDGVTLRLSRRSSLGDTTVVMNRLQKGGGRSFSYVIEISPTLLEDKGYDKMAIVGAILRGMARVWIWDEGAPQGLVDGMAEYVAEMAGFRREMVAGGGEMPECGEGWGGGRWSWEDKNPKHVARLLHYCEKYKKGFIQRLNEAMRDTWHDRVVDEVLGMPVMELCCRLYNNNNNNASWVGSISM